MILKIFVNSLWACQPSTSLRSVASSAIVLRRLRLVRAAAPTAHAVPLTIDDLLPKFRLPKSSNCGYIKNIRNPSGDSSGSAHRSTVEIPENFVRI